MNSQHHMKAPLSKETMDAIASGSLTPEQARSLLDLMEKDPFVAEVVETIDAKNWSAIKGIADSSTSKVAHQVERMGRQQKWLRNVGWASVLLLFIAGAFWLNNRSAPETSVKAQKPVVVVDEPSLEIVAAAVDTVKSNQTEIISPERVKNPVASSFETTEEPTARVSEATLEEVSEPIEEEVVVEITDTISTEEIIVDASTEEAPEITALSAGKKYQQLTIIKAQALGSRIVLEETKRKKQKQNGQLGGKDILKSRGVPDVIQTPQFYGGRQGVEAFALERLPDMNKLDYNYEKNTVAVQLMISSSGKIEEVVVMDGIHPTIDSAAVDIFKTMPDWEPGNVDIEYTVALTFN